jgi:adenine C2-methylase RlmN of 23S rRNA A2503 and tRNA A37
MNLEVYEKTYNLSRFEGKGSVATHIVFANMGNPAQNMPLISPKAAKPLAE